MNSVLGGCETCGHSEKCIVLKGKSPAKIVGWVAAVLLAVLMIGSGFGKIVAGADSPMAPQFQALGIWEIRQPLGIVEVIIAVLLLIPRMSTGGLLLAIGYWGGALATDLSHAGSPVVPLVALTLLAVIAILRNSEVMARFLGKPLPEGA
jgi:hypothetical protein